MEERANEGKKSPLDDIINHMTADWHHNYGLPPQAQAPAPPPQSSHVWSNWQGNSSGQAGSGQGSGPGAGTTAGRQNYFVLGGGEPSVPVFFQADQPPPGYQADPQVAKSQDFFSQSIQATAQNDGNDLGGTMVDIGGGKFVQVRYSGGHGGTVSPQYLPVSPGLGVGNVLSPPSLEQILPHPNQSDASHQHSTPANNYGLFSPTQQVQSLLRQSHLQLRTPESESPHPGLQHGPPGLLQPSQTLFNEHLQNQQFQQHIYAVTQHDLLQRVQRQHLEQQQQQVKQQHEQQHQIQYQPPQDKAAKNSSSSCSSFSQNQDQLIQNLVGNWTVPNQSGCYNPFGLTLTENNDSTPETVKDVEQPKKTDKSIRRTRIIAEVRPMRPSYSAVLTTPSPSPSPQKPNIPIYSVNWPNGNNQTNNCSAALITNSTNKINTDVSRPKGTCNSSSVKSKGSSSKSNGVASTSGKLKRQHSNGAEESNNKSGPPSASKSSGLSSSSSGDLDEPATGNYSPTSFSRRWVSLDDLESDISGAEATNTFVESGRPSEPTLRDPQGHDKKVVDKTSVRSGTRGNPKLSSSSVSDEGFLNNHKTPSVTGGPKGGGGIGPNSTKRPIHINNNLGTNHGSHWANHQSSNTSKGSSKNDSKSSTGGNSNNSMSGRSGRGSMGSMAEKAALLQGRRNHRASRKKDGVTAASLIVRKYGHLVMAAIIWFFHLLSDVVGMSLRLSLHLSLLVWENWVVSTASWIQKCVWRIPQVIPERISHSRIWRFLCGCLGKEDTADHSKNGSKKGGRGVEGRDSAIPGGLSQNISMPSSGEEAMKRLLACKGKDPYSILGVTPNCADDDVKKYYKRQAFLVHPDKNSQPGAEEAFKILVHAFELIGEPIKRAEYDRYVAETQQVEQAWSELSDLLTQLHRKMEFAANTIRCTNCGKRHKRVAVPRKPFAARFCAQCKIKHSAKEGDIWAETMVMGFLWHYYACMEGGIYDITDWASCQTNNLRHLKPNSHTVQYRIVLGRHRQPTRPPSEPDLENFLSSLYNQTGGAKGPPGAGESSGSTNVPNRQDTARNRKKGKRNK